MEEVAASNAVAGRQPVAHHQIEASLAAQHAQQLHERLLNVEKSANIVFAQVEA